MNFPIPDDVAGGAAAVGMLATIIWRMLFRAKADIRHDSGNSAEHSGYVVVIATLRDEVGRLSNVVSDMSTKLEVARAEREKSIKENEALKRRVAHLEQCVAKLREK